MQPILPLRPKLLAHNVYFSLHEGTEEARARLVRSCQEYLSDHPGIVLFACGILAEDLRREVNDLDFDVALHVLFRDQAAHDNYQVSEQHQQFIAENKHTWKKVRVFDSLVSETPVA